jgi:hypothetical protein
MGQVAARRHRDLEDFEEGHMQRVWDELHDRFHINSKEWKRKFEEEFLKQPHSISKVDFFRKYLVENFNGYLNHILCRYSWHPTIDNLMEYVVRKGLK